MISTSSTAKSSEIIILPKTFNNLTYSSLQRSIRRNRQYVCKSKTEGGCLVDKTHRNQCRACRLRRCISVGMNREAVQHERGPRNSTLRRQMSLFFKEHTLAAAASPTFPGNRGQNPGGFAATTSAASSASPDPEETSETPEKGSSSPNSTSSPHPSFHQQPPSPPMHQQPLAPPPLGACIPPPPPPASLLHPYGPYLRPSLPPFFIDPRIAAAMAANASAASSHSSSSSAFHPPPLPVSGLFNNGLLMPTPKYGVPVAPPPPPPPPAVLPQPPPMPTAAAENISEIAARLLFMNVRWAQHVPAFATLPYRDQMILLEETWRELFVLSAAQFHLPVELADMSPSETSLAALTELKAFQETIHKFQAMGVDGTEFACLRAIVLLKTTLESSSAADAAADDKKNPQPRELRDQAAINALQDQAQMTLNKYIGTAYPAQPQRFGKLLLLLPALRAVSARTVEEVFFKKTIGAIPLEKIICDMYKAGAAAAAAPSTA